MQTNIIIEIYNLRVTTDAHNTGHYSFDWSANIDGKFKRGGYRSSYSGQSSSSIRGKLKRGYSIQLAIQQFFGY